MIILGIDLSLTGTGLALSGSLSDKTGSFDMLRLMNWVYTSSGGHPLRAATIQTKDLRGYWRWVRIVDVVEEWAQFADLVVIEGYSFGSRLSHAHSLGEIGGIVRYRLGQMEKRYIDVPPTQLKKFATGKASADKNIVLLEVYKRYGVSLADDNQADALVLAMIGRALWGTSDDLPQFQKEVLAVIQAGPAPKKKKKGAVAP